MSHNPTNLAYVSPFDEISDDLTVGQLKRLKRAGRAIKRRAQKTARATFLLPGRAGQVLAAGAKRVGMAPATLLMKLRSGDTKRKQKAVKDGILKLARLKMADKKRGRQPWSWEQSVSWATAEFQRRGIPTKVKIDTHSVSGAWVTSGENVAYAGENVAYVGAPPGIFRYLLWLNPMSWFAASIRHTINQFKPEYGERPEWSPGAWKAAQKRKEAEAAESSEEAPEESEEEAPEGEEGEGEMEGIRRFLSKKVAGFKGGFLANLAARCAAGDRRACAIKERLRQRAATGNRRAAATYHALTTIQRRGLSGIAGDDTGFVPVAAFAATKYGPEMARFAMKNKGLISKAAKVVTRAKAGDKQANARIKMIDAGSKAGDVEALKAKTALLLAKEKSDAARKSGLFKIKAD